MGTASGHLPQSGSRDLSERYDDILSAGHMLINYELITWRISDPSMDTIMHSFRESVLWALRSQPAAEDLPDNMLIDAIYFFCKAVSKNYCYPELMQTLRRMGELKSQCHILSRPHGEFPHTSYFLNISRTIGDATMQVGMTFSDADNIVVFDEAQNPVSKGSLYRVETEFPLPLRAGFTPVYTAQAEFKKSFTEKIAASLFKSVACKQVAELATCKGVPELHARNANVDTFTMEPRRPLLDHEAMEAGCPIT